MQSKTITPRFLYVTAAIFIAAISRLLPHPPNFTPIAAMALFGGACLNDKRLSFIVPLMAMLVSDIVIGFHNTLIYVYASFIAISLIGNYLRNNTKTSNVILASLISSILFFVVTNFGVWAATGFEFGMPGLLNTYLIAIPFYSNSILSSFFLNTIFGDLFFNGILFGSLYFAKNKFNVLA